MKTNWTPGKLITAAALILALVGMTAAPMVSLAQEKGAELLTKSSRVSAVTATPESKSGCSAMIACPKCKDTSVTVQQAGGKGGRVETATLQRHECPNCSSKIVTTGTGKAASDRSVHICQNTKVAACCSMKQ